MYVDDIVLLGEMEEELLAVAENLEVDVRERN